MKADLDMDSLTTQRIGDQGANVLQYRENKTTLTG